MSINLLHVILNEKDLDLIFHEIFNDESLEKSETKREILNQKKN